MSQATSAARPCVVLDWRRAHRPAGTVRAVRDPGRVPLAGHGPALPQGMCRDLDHRPRPRRIPTAPG